MMNAILSLVVVGPRLKKDIIEGDVIEGEFSFRHGDSSVFSASRVNQ